MRIFGLGNYMVKVIMMDAEIVRKQQSCRFYFKLNKSFLINLCRI